MFSGALSLKPHEVTDSECLASRNPACLALDVSWWQGRRVRGFAPPGRPCATRGAGLVGAPSLSPSPSPRGAGSLGARTRVELPFPAAAPPDPTRPGPGLPGACAQRLQSQPASAPPSPGATTAHPWPRPSSRQPARAWLGNRGRQTADTGHSRAPRPSAAMAPISGDAGKLELGEVWSARPGTGGSSGLCLPGPGL